MDIIALFHHFLKRFCDLIPDTISINDLVQTSKEATQSFLLETLKAMIESIDAKFRVSPARKQDYHIKNRITRTLLTSAGVVTFQKTTYVHKRTRLFFSYIEDALGIDKWAKMTSELEAALIDKAVTSSLECASKLIPNLPLSRTTVSMKLKRLNTQHLLSLSVPETLVSPVETLYIEADEAHVSLQRSKQQQTYFSKLVLTHTGHDPSTGRSKRKKLHNKRYFTPCMESNEAFWQRVVESIYDTYDLSRVNHVFLSGDGAPWIEAGLKEFGHHPPFEIHLVLDRFHFNKTLRSLFAGDVKRIALAKEILASGNREAFELFCRECYNTHRTSRTLSPSEFEKHLAYLVNRFDSIRQQQHPSYRVGCSMEGHISHYPAARMTSRPKGFSLANATTLAQLQAFKLNGFSITAEVMDLMKNKTAPLFRKDAIDWGTIPSNLPVMNSTNHAYRKMVKHIQNHIPIFQI